MGVHRHSELPRHPGFPLSDDQVAVAHVLVLAISEYSESAYCAGWMHGIEHEIWDRLYPAPKEPYEIAVERLHRAAGREHTDWGDVRRELLRGLQLIAEQHRVWVYWDDKNADTAIHLDDWLPMHERWRAENKANRPKVQDVWESLHYHHKNKGPRPDMPPMPDLSDLGF